jgi:hypothetical protein
MDVSLEPVPRGLSPGYISRTMRQSRAQEKSWLMASESQLGLQEVLGPEETQQELWLSCDSQL